MNNKQAITIISNIDKAYRNFTDEEYQALDMALKALEKDLEIKEISKNLIQEKIKENERHQIELLSDMMRMKALNIYEQYMRGEQDERSE